MSGSEGDWASGKCRRIFDCVGGGRTCSRKTTSRTVVPRVEQVHRHARPRLGQHYADSTTAATTTTLPLLLLLLLLLLLYCSATIYSTVVHPVVALSLAVPGGEGIFGEVIGGVRLHDQVALAHDLHLHQLGKVPSSGSLCSHWQRHLPSLTSPACFDHFQGFFNAKQKVKSRKSK